MHGSRIKTGLAFSALSLALCVLICEAALGQELQKDFCVDGGFESGKGHWQGTVVIDQQVKHSGQASARCDNAEEQDESGASQLIVLNQSAAAPIVVSGWSKAENASGRADRQYSLWCDVEYQNDIRPGRVDDWHVVSFETGTHDWQYVETIFNPKHPIKQITFHALFRRTHKGTVWFDDLSVRPLSDGPLAGAAKDVPPLPQSAPNFVRLKEASETTKPDELFVFLKNQEAGGDPGNAFTCFFFDKPATPLALPGGVALVREIPLAYPSAVPRFGDAPQYVHVSLLRNWEEQKLVLESAGEKGGRIEWHVLLPNGAAVRKVTLEGWETKGDAVALHSLGGRLLLTLVTDVRANTDRCIVSLGMPAQEAQTDRARTIPNLRSIAANDGLKLGMGDDGGMWSVVIDAQDATSTDVTKRAFGLLVGDMFQGRFSQGKPAIAQDGKRVTVQTEYEGMGLRSNVVYEARADHIAVSGTIEDETGNDRPVDLLFRLPVGGEGWTWWNDIADGAVIGGNSPREMDDLTFACMTSPDGTKGIGLALSPEIPCRFKLGFEPAQSLFHLRSKYALTQDAKLKQKAIFAFAIFRVDGKWAMRDAARRCYVLYPEAFARRAMKEGGWLFAISPKKAPNLEDYGYYEGGAAMAEFCLSKGVLTFPYIIPGQRSIQPLPELPKDYDDAMRAFAEFQEKPKDHWGPQLKRMIENCRPVQADGTHHIVIRDDFGADIKPKEPMNMVVFSVNCDPDLFSDKPDEPTVGRFELDKVRTLIEEQPLIKGIYVDSTCGWVARTMNFRRDHFAYTDYPLTYDDATGRPCIDGMVTMYEFLKALGERLHPSDRYVFPNLGTWNKICWHYFVTDVVGLEGHTIELPRLRYARTLAYQKPTLRLDYIISGTKETDRAAREGLELFFKRCAVYGIHPSIGRYCDKVYEQFPDLYRTYMPIIRRLGAAGWEPVTHAASGDPKIVIERFGPRNGELLFTLYNEGGDERRAAITLDMESLGLKRIVGASELFGAAADKLSFALHPDELRVLALKVE